jgi:hypothetical protein
MPILSMSAGERIGNPKSWVMNNTWAPVEHIVDSQCLGQYPSVRPPGPASPAPDSAVRGEALLGSAGKAGTDALLLAARIPFTQAAQAGYHGRPPHSNASCDSIRPRNSVSR